MNKENFEEQLNTWIADIKNIKMTDGEKKHILESIMNSPITTNTPVPSPFQFEFMVSFFQGKHLRAFQYVSIACLVLLLSGAGVGLAAKGTLPGHTLYGVKVKALEPMGLFFKTSAESKAKYESSLVSERLKEAEALASSGKLDDSSEETLSNLLEHHTSSLNNYRQKLPQDAESEKIDEDIVSDFENKVNARMESLDRIRNQENEIAEQETKINKAARASVEKVKEVKAKKELRDLDI